MTDLLSRDELRHQKGRNAYRSAYYQAHREEKSAYDAVYRADHGDALHEKKAKEFAEFTEWLQVLRTVNGCADCEKWLSDVDELIIDIGHDKWLDIPVREFQRMGASGDPVAMVVAWNAFALTRAQIASLLVYDEGAAK